MPNCAICKQPVITGLVVHSECFTEREQPYLVLPCNVGDTIYVVTRCENIIMYHDNDYINGTGAIDCPFEYACEHEECDDNNVSIVETVCQGFYVDEEEKKLFLENLPDIFLFEHVGSTVFLTREEAEQALKG